MIILYKEEDDCWVWTAEANIGYELSPRYKTQLEALQWRGDVSFEIHRDYSMLASGQRVVIPVNRVHAHMILDNVVKYLQNNDGYQPATATAKSVVSVPMSLPVPVANKTEVISDPNVPARPN
jgi:hypothetical protein